MNYTLYTRVALRIDIPEKNLKRGDIATVVDTHPGSVDGEEGYSLEVFNAVGDTIAVVVVPSSAIEPLHSNEILHVRHMNEMEK